MSELTLPDAARSNNFKQLERCSRLNSECKYILILVQNSVQMHIADSRYLELDAIHFQISL